MPSTTTPTTSTRGSSRRSTPTPPRPPEPPPLRESMGGMACRWMERMLIHGEGDRHAQPYRLLPWQREFNWRWFELDPAQELGTPWWFLEALIGAERGAVKTE